MQIHHYHGFDESKIERLNTSSLKLKRKFSKLKEDHKILLGILFHVFFKLSPFS